MDAQQVIERAQARAAKTWVFEHPAGYAVILAHPGQELNRDPVSLRRNFGIMEQHVREGRVKLLSDSELHRPRTEAEKAVDRAGSKQARLEQLRAEVAALEAELAGEPAVEPAEGSESAAPEASARARSAK